MLFLIGIGIWDEFDMSLRGLAEAKKCDKLYAEFYTTRPGTDVKKLSELTGKKVTELSRSEFEENSAALIKEAGKKDIGIFVGGDPLTATTHVSLLISAKKRGIPFKIIHSSSIYTAAAGACGLFIYKFGRSATLTFWSDNYKPTSPYEAIVWNRRQGFHTLLFLDISERPMPAQEAIALLQTMEKELKGKICRDVDPLVVISRLGSGQEKITYGTLKELKKKELGGAPHTIIIPGNLHFIEKESLQLLSSP